MAIAPADNMTVGDQQELYDQVWFYLHSQGVTATEATLYQLAIGLVNKIVPLRDAQLEKKSTA